MPLSYTQVGVKAAKDVSNAMYVSEGASDEGEPIDCTNDSM